MKNGKYGHLLKLKLVSEAVNTEDVEIKESAIPEEDIDEPEIPEEDIPEEDIPEEEDYGGDYGDVEESKEIEGEEPTERVSRKRMEIIVVKLNELLDTYSDLFEVLDSADINGDDRVLLDPPMGRLKTSIDLLEKYISDNKEDTFAIKTRNLLLFRTTLNMSKNQIDQVIYDNTIEV